MLSVDRAGYQDIIKKNTRPGGRFYFPDKQPFYPKMAVLPYLLTGLLDEPLSASSGLGALFLFCVS